MNRENGLTAYAVYIVLFLSTAYVSTLVLPVLNTLIGRATWLNLIPVLVPLATGLLASELFEGESLLRTGIIGTGILGVSSSLGEITNRLLRRLNSMINEVYTGTPSEAMQESGVAGLIGNLDSAGVNPVMVFLMAGIGYNIPVLYRYLKNGDGERIYLTLYIFPLVVAVGLVYGIRLLFPR
jgi:hypothetical protein